MRPGGDSPQVFEKKWGNSTSTSTSLKLSRNVTEGNLDQAMASANMHVVAKGKQGGNIKAYYIGEREDGAIFMAELIVNVSSKQLTATLKSDARDDLGAFEGCLTGVLS